MLQAALQPFQSALRTAPPQVPAVTPTTNAVHAPHDDPLIPEFRQIQLLLEDLIDKVAQLPTLQDITKLTIDSIAMCQQNIRVSTAKSRELANQAAVRFNIPTTAALATTPPPRASEIHPKAWSNYPVSSASSDISESVTDLDDTNPYPWVTIAQTKRIKKPLATRPAGASIATPINPTLAGEFKELSEEELLAKLREREKERRAAAREPEFLTEVEKRLTLDELHRKWRAEEQLRRQERPDLRRCDYVPLGELTEAEKLLPRREVKRIIRNKRHAAWVQSMHDQGIPLHICDICHDVATDRHQCMKTKWLTEGRKKDAIAKGIVISSTPAGVRLKTQTLINEDQLQREYDQLARVKAELEEKVRQLTHRVSEAAGASETPDIEMTTPANPPIAEAELSQG